MGVQQSSHGWQRVHNDTVWRYTKLIFLGSLLVFLINITLGFWNIVRVGDIPHWQLITHLHGATLGWLTVSAVGFTVWLFTGNREVSSTYVRRIKWLAWGAVLIAAGYVLSFGIGFYTMGNAYALLPIFGTGMMLVIWSTALLAWTQLRDQPSIRTVHLLVAGALTVASLGAIMGVLLGLQHAIGPLDLPGNIPNVSNHAGPMDIYALIMGAALIEWLVDGDEVADWTWPGAFQAGVWTLGGLMAFVPIEAVGGIGSLIGFLGGTIIFLLRMGWRAVLTNPFEFDTRTWGMVPPLWIVVFVGGFLAFSMGILSQDTPWAGPVLFHAYFVGYITNSIFGVFSQRTSDTRRLHEWAEPGAFWLINLGLVTFAATEIARESRYGAVVMGLGVLLGVLTMGYRLTGE